MFSGLARVTSRTPVLVLVIAAALSLISLIAGTGLSDKLSTQGFENESSESQKALESVAEATGYDPTEDIIAIVSVPKGQQITGAAGIARADRVARALAKIEGVKAVENPLAPGVPPQVTAASISRDGNAVVVRAHTTPGAQDGSTAADAKAATADIPGLKLGGSLIAQRDISDIVSADLRRSELIAFPLLFLISLIVFRSLLAALLPLLVGAITIPLTMMMVSFYNEATSLSIFALNLTTGLGLGLAIDYSLLSITRYREEIAAGADPATAIDTTLNTAGRTIVYSAVTVAGSLLVLAIFPLKFLYSMAFAGATVALASALVALTVLPAALRLIGKNLDRFSLARKPVYAGTRRWYRLARGVMRDPGLVAIAVTAVILIFSLPVLNLSFTSVDASVLPADNSAHIVEKEIERDFPGGNAATVFVAAHAGADNQPAVERLQRQILKRDNVTGVSPPLHLGNATWSFDVATRERSYAKPALDAVSSIRGVNATVPFEVGGRSASFVDQRETILDRVPLALLLILVVTFIVLFLMTGSVVLPIKTFLMNLMTMAATFGILSWIFGEGHLEGLLGYHSQGALEMTQPVLLFALAFALATDYGVFLLGRIKELHDGGLNNDESVARGLALTGRVITSAALLLCIAIGTFSLSGIVFIKELGIGAALAVMIDATMIRALLVPSLMAMLGEYNWWAPRWMHRLHDRIGLDEGPSAPAAGQPQSGEPSGERFVVESRN